MEIIESIKNNKAYNKYKLFVKKWEKEFKTSHSRIPSKLDIKEAPAKVRYAYKMYFQLKSAALETTLIDCQIEDESFCNSPDFLPMSITAMIDNPSPKSDQFEISNLPSSEQLGQLLFNVSTSEHIVSPPKRKLQVPADLAKPLTDNLSKKLFKNSKFSIRNPRKSLSFRASQSKVLDHLDSTSKINDEVENNINLSHDNFNITSNLTLPMTESKPEKDSIVTNTINMSCISNTTKGTPLRQINERWVERASGLSFDTKTETHNTPSAKDKFGLRNIHIECVEPCDVVENSESENEDTAVSLKLKPAFKKRKLNNCDVQIITKDNEAIPDRTVPNIPDNTEVKKTSPTVVSKTRLRKSKQNVRKKVVPKKVDPIKEDEMHGPPDIDDFVPVNIEESITPRFNKESEIFTSKKTKHTKQAGPRSNMTKGGTAASKLEQKVQNGTLNENFVRINIQKKVFVRGKKSMNFSKYKKKQWKDKKALNSLEGMEFPEGGKMSCFKCGATGHMARYCTAHRGDMLLPISACETDTIPTLEDMEKSVLEAEFESDTELEQIALPTFTGSAVPESFLKLLAEPTATGTQGETKEIQSIYTGHEQSTPQEMIDALKMFGHQSFRPGQEEAMKRILSGLSTLLILSTGSGKSLCYQLPAYIYSQHYKCITLVISPLVSLMEDQVLSMPEFLKAGCLHTNQPPTQRRKIVQCLKDGELNVLLISPEALISGDRSNGLGGIFKVLPPIAFACIDEAHCVSQWSHNFRPSYLMICRVLREKLKVNCILGLTATASQPTIKSIITHINVPDGISGVITNPTLPDNLILSVSFEKDIDRSLVNLLSSEKISSYNSIIVYCIRRDECQRVAGILRSSLHEPGKISMEKPNKKRKRMSYTAEAYHAGMSAAQRRKIQNNFMDGTLRIIVATVAFGMGINKADIRCIIHYNMPSSFESYVQEVGRAGRDGLPAHCHVFMNSNNTDKNELLKHIHSNTIDRHVIRKLLQKVFVPCDCSKNASNGGTSTNAGRCSGHEVAFSIDDTVEELDLASENIATLLCYLELHHKNYIKVLNNAYMKCKIFSYGGPQKLIEAAKKCPPLAMAYILESKNDSKVKEYSTFEFSVIDAAAAIGWESGLTKYHLKNLEWILDNGSSRRSQLKVEFNTLAFRIKAPGDLTSVELDNMLDELHERVISQEKTMLYQLEEINRAFSKVAKTSLQDMYLSAETDCLSEQSDQLKVVIRDYFQRENIISCDIDIEERPLDVGRATSDIRAIISSYRDCTFTGRSIARILQGIQSPNYPAIVWGRCKFWRTHLHEDFNGLAKLATQQIIEMKFR